MVMEALRQHTDNRLYSIWSGIGEWNEVAGPNEMRLTRDTEGYNVQAFYTIEGEDVILLTFANRVDAEIQLNRGWQAAGRTIEGPRGRLHISADLRHKPDHK